MDEKSGANDANKPGQEIANCFILVPLIEWQIWPHERGRKEPLPIQTTQIAG